MTVVALAVSGDDVPVALEPPLQGADRHFRAVLAASGLLVLGLLVAIIAYLWANGWHTLRSSGMHFFISDRWAPPFHFGILGALAGSVAIALLALVMALPLSVATALMINEYAPARIRRWLIALVDLLATVPSIVFGLWGLNALSVDAYGTTKWLNSHASFIPIMRTTEPGTFGGSVFLCGLVVGVMIVPIVTSVSREIMAQAPREACEAALALGGTKWGMATDVILPFARNGILGGALLGLGRALGETMAVLIILSSANVMTPDILGPNGLGAVAKLIADFFTSSAAPEKSALTLAGLTLFGTTLIVNLAARATAGKATSKVAA